MLRRGRACAAPLRLEVALGVEHAQAQGMVDALERFQRLGAICLVDIDDHVADATVGLQVLRRDVDASSLRTLLISDITPGTFSWMCSRRCLSGWAGNATSGKLTEVMVVPLSE